MKRAHFIGAGGIGTSAMAKLLKARGVYVSASDVKDSETLQELRDLSIQTWVGSHPEKIGKDVELVVYSSAVPEEDEERIRGRHIGAREVTYNEFLGEVSRGSKLIAVTGTHGKSTTTAMIGHVLIEAGLDPTVVVGSKVPGFTHGNLRIGKSDIFVAEACEHMAHMLHLDPWMAVVTNIELDHPDFYRDEQHVYDTMKAFAQKIAKGGVLIVNGNDRLSKKLGDETAGELEAAGSTVVVAGKLDDAVTLRLPGSYNRENAAMAWAVASKLGVDGEVIARALGSFTGLWRRFEYLGEYSAKNKGNKKNKESRGGPMCPPAISVYTDYAHHPTALRRLIEGAREFLPNRRIVVCFEPHQHARTKGLFDDFVVSMDAADAVIVSEIYGVAGRTEDQDISSADLVDAIRTHDADRKVDRPVVFASDLADAKEKIDGVIKSNDVLLMVGAGDVDGLARSIATRPSLRDPSDGLRQSL